MEEYYFPLSSLRRSWLDGVLPAVMDREESAKEKCLSIMEEIILSELHLKPSLSVDGETTRTDQKETFAWRLLNIIAEEEEQDLR